MCWEPEGFSGGPKSKEGTALMKTKFIGALIVGTALFIGVVLWRVDSFVSSDRQTWVESQTRTQVSAINFSIASELKSLQKKLGLFTSDVSSRERIPWNTMAPFFGVATYMAQGKTYEVQSFIARDSSKASSWTADFVRSAMGSLPEVGSATRYFIKPFQDQQKNRFVGIVFLEGARATAVFSSGELFQSIVDSQRNSLSQFSIITESGQMVGHLTPEYVGTVIRDDAVFENFESTRSTYGTLVYGSKAGSFFGMYEKVPETNLMTLANASLGLAQKGKWSFITQLALLGLGLAIVGVALGMWMLNPMLAQQDNLLAEVQALKFKNNQLSIGALSNVTTALPNEGESQKQKLEVASRIASTLAHEMSGPLASIMGFSQMILAKKPDAEIEQAAQSIVREARTTRTVLDKLLGYAGEEIKNKTETKVEGPLATALKQVESQLKQKGVKVTQNLGATTAFAMNTAAISRAIANILENSIEAMERMAHKEIVIDLFEDTDGIHLTISDKGEGMDATQIQNAFDPFFTTRSVSRHMGLGLSYAFGVFKEHQGNMTITSARGEGTQIKVLIRPEAREALLANATKDEAAAAISMDVVKLPENSEHRPEAEATFEMAKDEMKKESPLDVNIESLLDLPDEKEVADLKKQEPVVKPALRASSDLQFRDGFLDDNGTDRIEASAQSGEVAGPTESELESMNDDLTPVDFIVPPAMAPREAKKSKLADYHVEIRRPGKRI